MAKQDEGVEVECHRCHYKWTYTGAKIALAQAGQYPVYTSCPRCRASSVKVAIPAP